MTTAEADLDAAEARIAALPGEGPGLDPAAERAYVKARRRIHRHHAAWRAGMPALDTLFDHDAHRARALAGSVCTEMEDALVKWGEIRAGAGRADEAARSFLREAAARWRGAAAEIGACHEWSEGAAEVFASFVDELGARASARALAALEGDGAARSLPAPRWGLALRRLLRGPVVALRRFLRPDAAPRSGRPR